MALRVLFDTSALLDLFGRWTDDHRERRGDLVREVHILAPLRPFLFSTEAIREEVHRHMVVGADLARYVAFEALTEAELQACAGFTEPRRADFSLLALARRFEREGHRTFLLTKDRTFVRDLGRCGSNAAVVPPTGFAEAITILCAGGTPNEVLAHRIQNNAFVNLSRHMRLVREEQGEGAYADWQAFLNGRTAAKHELVEAMRGTGVRL